MVSPIDSFGIFKIRRQKSLITKLLYDLHKKQFRNFINFSEENRIPKMLNDSSEIWTFCEYSREFEGMNI